MVLVESRKTTYASAISDTGDKVEFPPKRHANASRLVTPKAKDVVATTPSMPRAWSDTFLTDKPAECVEEYVEVMVHSVSIRLHECLSQAPTRGGISLQGPLHAQTSIDVAKANRNIDVKSYKEALNKRQLLEKSLTASGVYEAAGNAFWLSLASLFAWEGDGIVLGSEISWTRKSSNVPPILGTFASITYIVVFFFYSGFVFSPVHWRLVPGSPLLHWTCVALGVVVQHG